MRTTLRWMTLGAVLGFAGHATFCRIDDASLAAVREALRGGPVPEAVR